MGRVRKPRVEGAQAIEAVVVTPVDPEIIAMGRAAQAKEFAEIWEYFRVTYPEKWAELAKCPAEAALAEMVELLA